MTARVTNLFGRGTTWYGPSQTISGTDYGRSKALEGHLDSEVYIDKSGLGPYTRLEQRITTYRLVRNVSGVSLLPKRIVKWKTGKRDQQVDGYCAVDYEEVAGVVDDSLPAAGVRDNDLFWLAVKGPQLVTTAADTTASVYAEFDVLLALTAAASTTSTTAGRPQSAAGTWTLTQVTDGTAYKQTFNSIGRALSATTSGNTNSNLLVDLHVYKD